jgi:hypothetical protein
MPGIRPLQSLRGERRRRAIAQQPLFRAIPALPPPAGPCCARSHPLPADLSSPARSRASTRTEALTETMLSGAKWDARECARRGRAKTARISPPPWSHASISRASTTRKKERRTAVAVAGSCSTKQRRRARMRQHLPCRTGCSGKTRSTRCAAVSALRRAPQAGHSPRTLQEKGIESSSPQCSQRARAKPWARMPHSRYWWRKRYSRWPTRWPAPSPGRRSLGAATIRSRW